ncbi:2OG-Fe(II) oxygenase [Pantoea ananatis]
MNILNMSAFDSSDYYKDPWEWGVLCNLISLDWIKKIKSELSMLTFHKVASDRTHKHYCMEVFNPQKQEMKSYILNQVILELTSANYLEALELFTNSKLRGREIELNFWRYSATDYLSPHVDKEYKFLTQLIYFNEYWEVDYGGSLNILRSRSQEDLYKRILPLYNLSPLIMNSRKAWHSVSPVSANAPSRYCLQMIYKE